MPSLLCNSEGQQNSGMGLSAPRGEISRGNESDNEYARITAIKQNEHSPGRYL